MNDTAVLTAKDAKKVKRAALLLGQVLDKLPAELTRLGVQFTPESSRRAVEAREAKRAARRAAEAELAEAAA